MAGFPVVDCMVCAIDLSGWCCAPLPRFSYFLLLLNVDVDAGRRECGFGRRGGGNEVSYYLGQM